MLGTGDRVMRGLRASVILSLAPVLSFGEDLPPPSQPLVERVEEVIKPAKDDYLKAKTVAQERYKKVLDAELDKATKAGSLDDVKALQKEQEVFAADESAWKSAAHKAAIRKYTAEVDAALKRFVATLDVVVKDQVKIKNIELAEKVRELRESSAESLSSTPPAEGLLLGKEIECPKEAGKFKYKFKHEDSWTLQLEFMAKQDPGSSAKLVLLGDDRPYSDTLHVQLIGNKVDAGVWDNMKEIKPNAVSVPFDHDDKWHKTVFKYNAADKTITLIVDSQKATAKCGVPIKDRDMPLFIGSAGTGEPFSGKIRNVYLYNTR
jgi:hypothetical protein